MSTHLQRAHLLIEQSRYELAEQELRQALASNPNDPLAHALLALCLSEQKKFADANHEARTAIHLAPDRSFVHYAMARVWQGQEKHREAEASVHEAIRLDPEDADYFALLANLRFQMRRWKDALESAEKGLEIDAEHVGCTNLRAMALMKLGRREEAGTTIDAALHRDPENAVTHANQGWTLLERGEHVKAMEHFREALRLEPEMEWARQGIVEALKAHNVIYRAMLKYFFFMSRLTKQAQWGIIIGAYVISRFLRGPFLWLYLIFAVMTWIAPSLFNLLLRINRFGRLALSRDEIVASNWVGLCLLAGGAFLVAGFGLNRGLLILAAVGCLGLVVAVAGTFKRTGRNRKILAGYTIALTVIGAAALGLALNGSEVAGTFGVLFAVGVFLFQLLANAMIRY